MSRVRYFLLVTLPLLLSAPLPLRAEVATLLPPAEWLGPLFYTPEERRALERARAQREASPQTTDAAEKPYLQALILEPPTRRGVWIGRTFYPEGSAIGPYTFTLYRHGIVLQSETGEAVAVPLGAPLPFVP